MKKDNDIIIKDDDAIFFFQHLGWDTNFFNKPAYIFDISRSNILISNRIRCFINEKLKKCFVTIKLDTNIDYAVINFFQDCGFKYIDTEIVLEYMGNKNFTIDNRNIEIIKIKENKNIPYEELGSSFELTRFHTDINITNKKADKLWVEYIRNYEISPKKHMFTAIKNGVVLGVILVNLKNEVAYIFFVSVLKKYQSMGVGSSLLNSVIHYFDGYKIRTGTQVKNIGSQNFYIKNGFSRIYATNTVLHRW